MAKQTFKMYMVVGTGSCNHGRVFLQSHDPSINPSSSDYLIGARFLKEVECEFDVPEFDLRQMEIECLEGAVKQERADSQVRANLLLDRISKLKAIGHDG